MVKNISSWQKVLGVIALVAAIEGTILGNEFQLGAFHFSGTDIAGLLLSIIILPMLFRKNK